MTTLTRVDPADVGLALPFLIEHHGGAADFVVGRTRKRLWAVKQ
jgi:hypothetical protein